MNGFENVLLSYVLNSLWQAPLLFVAAWIAARMLRTAGPAAEHRVWVGALLLQSLLPAVSIFPWQRVHFEWPWQAQGAAIGNALVSVQMGSGAGFAALRIPPAMMAALAIVYAALTGYFIARFVWRCVRLSALTRRTESVRLSGEAALSCERWSDRLGIMGPIALVYSDEVFAPITMGVAQRRVMLPAGMLISIRLSRMNSRISGAMTF
jgi:hypothetical protein